MEEFEAPSSSFSEKGFSPKPSINFSDGWDFNNGGQMRMGKGSMWKNHRRPTEDGTAAESRVNGEEENTGR